MPTTYNDLYLDIRRELKAAGIEASTLEARELVCYGSGKTREELVSLMDKDIWITPTQAKEYGLIDEIVALDGAEEEADPAAYVAAAGSRYRLTAAMRQQYRDHMAAERIAEERKRRADCIRARLRVLNSY